MAFYVSLFFASAASIIILVSYRYMKITNRYGLAAVSLPLALVAVFPALFSSAYLLIEGFRGMALSGSGGLSNVMNLILEANRSAYWGHLASLPPLILLLMLSTFLLWKRRESSSTPASPRRSLLIITTAGASILAVAAASEITIRTPAGCDPLQTR